LQLGLLSFAPKYIETQFGLPGSVGSLLNGAVAIPAARVGIMLGKLHCFILLCDTDFVNLTLGALLVFLRKPMTKTLILYFAVLNFIGAFIMAAFFVKCSSHHIAGITVSYPNR